MSKKNYQVIARALYESREPDNPVGVFVPTASEMRMDIIGRIADVLAAGNPRFDRARFLEACETGRCKGMR